MIRTSQAGERTHAGRRYKANRREERQSPTPQRISPDGDIEMCRTDRPDPTGPNASTASRPGAGSSIVSSRRHARRLLFREYLTVGCPPQSCGIGGPAKVPASLKKQPLGPTPFPGQENAMADAVTDSSPTPGDPGSSSNAGQHRGDPVGPAARGTRRRQRRPTGPGGGHPGGVGGAGHRPGGGHLTRITWLEIVRQGTCVESPQRGGAAGPRGTKEVSPDACRGPGGPRPPGDGWPGGPIRRFLRRPDSSPGPAPAARHPAGSGTRARPRRPLSAG